MWFIADAEAGGWKKEFARWKSERSLEGLRESVGYS